jgi:hypothetical protein
LQDISLGDEQLFYIKVYINEIKETAFTDIKVMSVVFENLYYKYVCHRGGGWNCKIPCSYTQITLSQFKSHVLKEIEDNQDNQDYLIKLLKEISNEVK